jgi:hypothetical protein
MTNKQSSRRSNPWIIILGLLLAIVIAFFAFVSRGSAPDAPGQGEITSERQVLATSVASVVPPTPSPTPLPFDGERAFQDLVHQVGLGPRIPGSLAHGQLVDWITAELVAAGWQAELQETMIAGKPIRNVIGKLGGGGQQWIILGAHFDTRIYADKDPDQANRTLAIDGANDGASGVAVLLELARVMPRDLSQDVWLVFFDAEDNGGIDGWEWIMGSQAFVNSLEENPDAAVILDMIGDADLTIHLERNSDPALAAEIWSTAAALGYDGQFIPTAKYSILDDHVPFLQAGIPAVDIIDFDYPYHHTLADSLDKVSSASLQIVGETMLAWLIGDE